MPILTRRTVLGGALALCATRNLPAKASQQKVYIGAFAHLPPGLSAAGAAAPASAGIYSFALDTASGQAGTVLLAAATLVPGNLILHSNRRVLYAGGAADTAVGGDCLISAYAIAGDQLRPLNSVRSGGSAPSHGVVDRRGRNLLTVNWSSGSLICIALKPDGSLGARSARSSGPARWPRQSQEPRVLIHCRVRPPLSARDATGAHRGPLAPMSNLRSSPRLMPIVAWSIASMRTRAASASTARRQAIRAPDRGIWPFIRTGIPSIAQTRAARVSVPGAGRPAQGPSGCCRACRQRQLGRRRPIILHTWRFIPAGAIRVCIKSRAWIHRHIRVGARGTLEGLAEAPLPASECLCFAIEQSGQWLIAALETGSEVLVFSIDQRTGALSDTNQRLPVSVPSCIQIA